MKVEWLIERVQGEYQSQMQLAADAALVAQGIMDKPCAVSICLTDDEGIRRINAQKRGIDKITDVLSFPTLHYPKGKTLKEVQHKLSSVYDDDVDAAMLGDIVISLPQVIRQAQRYGNSIEREASYMVVHALCHLMGYDHMTDEDKREMRIMEEKALNAIGMPLEGEDMPASDAQLLALARQAKERAYVPYSKFRVGAALLCEDGSVITGCNIENASFGLTNCAERTAIFKAVSEGHDHFTTVAIASDEKAAWPCGACRQVLNEFAPDIRVIITWGKENQTAEATLPQLLPHGFGPKELE